MNMNQRIVQFFERRPEVVAVYLFGSHARRRARETSDIDLAILLDLQTRLDEFNLKREWMIGLSRVLRKDFHLVILNRAGETLSAQIFKYGQCLYNSKPGTLSRFKTIQFSRIADFAYLRNMMERGFARKIMEGAP